MWTLDGLWTIEKVDSSALENLKSFDFQLFYDFPREVFPTMSVRDKLFVFCKSLLDNEFDPYNLFMTKCEWEEAFINGEHKSDYKKCRQIVLKSQYNLLVADH